LSFEKLKVIEPILKALQNEGYTNPTPIQEQSIPLILERKDIFGCAQTGTGKTAAFAIPVLQLLYEEKQLANRKPGIKVLVLTPTRELAIQIQESFEAYGKFTGLRSMVIFGGVSQYSQVNTLRRGVDILIATPGRLLDLINQNYVNLNDIKWLILDEADRMLDMGFVHDVKRIIARIPRQRQTLFFSATVVPEIRNLANSILNNPIKVEVTPVSSTAKTIQQGVYFVEKRNKQSLLIHLLKNPAIETALVFARTKHGADKVTKALNNAGIRADAIHGGKSQEARQRALRQFKPRQVKVLVATDIAARGIDIDELSHVFNFELPNIPETYVHRIGRTGRAGSNGVAYSFCDHEEKEFLRDIQRLISVSIPVISDHPFPMSSAPINGPVLQRAVGNPRQSNFSRMKSRSRRYV